MLKWMLITVGAMVGGVLLLGLPGALVFVLTAPFQALVYGRDFWSNLHGDKAWPMAILIAVIWPLALGPAQWIVSSYLGHLSKWGKAGAYAGLLYVWCVVVSLVCYKVAAKWL